MCQREHCVSLFMFVSTLFVHNEALIVQNKVDPGFSENGIMWGLGWYQLTMVAVPQKMVAKNNFKFATS